ncbi:TBC1 domain family member 20 isoform X1 [Silurus meridionalis]|nr:TBC1 domain family member 20 isoform X1 [Silurus meridionalis]XP_046691487.1 TBC1 domain family member 20 isoform X1 [Silurus meridionalis]XP_046691488.1 TBC1 domain family member 20 isoform X1 [Silurus meridionalis]
MNLREMKKVKKRHQLNESRTETPGRLEDHMSWKKQKLADIQKALYSDPVDIETLRTAAVSKGGLLTDDVRRKVWPKLLSVNVFDLPAKPAKNIRENHKDHNQVLLDVRRSVSRFPKGMRTAERLVLQEQLIDIILDILRRNPQLHYYQGYHDIAITFLLVVGERMAIALVEKLSKHHLRDFMDPTMDSTKHILNYLMPIIEQVNPKLHDFMLRAEVGTIFALSWLITWYGHVLSDFRHILRLYDFFLASHPLMPIYFAAAIVLYREQEVKSCECDMASVHQLLSRIPQNLPYEQLITRTQTLFTRYPPTLLSSSTTLQSHNSIAISSFKDFQTSTLQQRPDFILRQQRQHLQQRQDAHLALVQQSPWYNSAQPGSAQQLIRMAVWGISATLGAAALAITQTAMNWAPDFLLQLF